MALDVIISNRAEQNLDEIIGYLRENWSEKTKLNFLAQLSEKINQIAKMPYMCRASRKKKGLREAVINKYIILYYRVSSQAIEIVTIQDSRKNSDELDL